MGMPAGAGGEAAAAPGTSYVQILMIVGVFAVFWFLIIRPQRKKQKETKNMLSAIKKGDKVTSIGGIKGTVKNVSETSVIVEVDTKGSTLEFTKSAIGSVDTVAPGESAPAKKEKPSKDQAEDSADDE
jgi:preprotein translocase subunit YajC